MNLLKQSINHTMKFCTLYITNDDEYFDSETRQDSQSIIKNMKMFNSVLLKKLLSTTNALLLQLERNNDEHLNGMLIVSEIMAMKCDIDPDNEFNIKHRRRKSPRRTDENSQTTCVFKVICYYK